MRPYMTAQRRKLMEFLRENPDRQFTAKDIAENLSEEAISVSAVYRNLNALEESGQVVCVLHKGIRDKYYHCPVSEECRSSLHMTCTKCGKSLHMNAEDADRLIAVQQDKNGFRISTVQTVIYGVCRDCNK